MSGVIRHGRWTCPTPDHWDQPLSNIGETTLTDQPNPNVDDVTGYRRLTDTEIELLNEGKALGQQIDTYLAKLDALPATQHTEQGEVVTIDKRWLSIGRTDMQKGLMAVIRSIAKPTSF